MTWTAFHTRGETLRDVIAAADERRDGLLPMDVEGVAERFDGPLDLLSTLQLRWHTRLAGRIERELMSEPMDLESGVVAAWHATTDEMPGVRAILDHYRAEPLDPVMARTLARSVAKERLLLAVTAGHSGVADELGVRVGERIEKRARATYVPRLAPQPERTSLLDRLRAALVA